MRDNHFAIDSLAISTLCSITIHKQKEKKERNSERKKETSGEISFKDKAVLVIGNQSGIALNLKCSGIGENVNINLRTC